MDTPIFSVLIASIRQHPQLSLLGIVLVLLLTCILLLLRLQRLRALNEAWIRLDARLDLLTRQHHQQQQQLIQQQQHEHQHNSHHRVQLMERFEALKHLVAERLGDNRSQLISSFSQFQHQQEKSLAEHRHRFEQRQAETARAQLESLHTGMTEIQKQVAAALTRSSTDLGQRVSALTGQVEEQLKAISGQVDMRLNEGFEKTTATFADVLKRLTIIDEAQKRITELSTNVVSLQQVLTDKRSRGAFGEVQLAALVRNIMPENSFTLQATLSNGKRADCLLQLPEPSGNIVIDAKFPLESYRAMLDHSLEERQRSQATRQFKLDIRKHIDDIASKYILAGETADGAIMFIPAEAIFAEIHAHHSELVERAGSARVWMVSPTTLWAILNTARAVLKDADTCEQVHIIQEHLAYLGKDFERFQQRMEDLARHVEQAHNDAQKVNISARKISSRFEQIERVELESPEAALPQQQSDKA